MPDKIFNSANNPKNWLKDRLKNHLIRYYGYPVEKYANNFLSEFMKCFVVEIETIFLYGFMTWFFFLGLRLVFKLTFFELGTMWYSVIIMFFMGFIVMNLKRVIEWRGGK